MGSIWPLISNRIYSVVQISNIEMGVTFSAYGRQDRCMQDFGGDNIVKDIAWEIRRWWEKIIKSILKMWNVEAWTDLGQYWDMWQALLIAVIILRVL